MGHVQFEKVFVLNLPERTDKLDAFRLSASLTGFRFDVLPGVRGDSMSGKALPYVRPDETSGCRRRRRLMGFTENARP